MSRPTDPYPSPPPRRFTSLRSKFVVFLSLIIIVTCSGLSGYFIQSERAAMMNELAGLGTILVNNLAFNGRYSLITEDPILLDRLIDGALAVDEVVYVVISGPEGRQLAAKSKGRLVDPARLTRDGQAPVYPDPGAAQAALAAAATTATITPFRANGGEGLYDFAVPVTRQRPEIGLQGPLALEPEESKRPAGLSGDAPAQVLGAIQIGLTGEKRKQSLRTIIWDVAFLTGVIILIGILATTTLAGRIITPLRSLASAARRVAEGDLTASMKPTTHDEVGQLTEIFNQMTRSLG